MINTMEESRYTRPRMPRSTRNDYYHDDEEYAQPSGCFGISFRSTTPPQRQHSREHMPRTHFDTQRPGALLDPYDLPVSDVKGYSIQGKSAEILGLIPKSTPVTPPKSRTPSPVVWRSTSGNQYSRSTEPSLVSSKSNASIRHVETKTSDPLILVRRKLREEAESRSSAVRSSSAPPPPSRNYSRKWRKSQGVRVTTPDRPRDFFDTSSMDGSIEEEEVPDTNKFDTASKRSSFRIRSAAFTTFAWMKLQDEAASLLDGVSSQQGRGSWLLDSVTSPPATSAPAVANESKKRTHAVTRSEASRLSAKRDDKRDTLEWMGVKPGDFPAMISSV